MPTTTTFVKHRHETHHMICTLFVLNVHLFPEYPWNIQVLSKLGHAKKLDIVRTFVKI